MNTAIISSLVGLFCTTVSSFITFLLTKRKYNAEANNQEIDNVNDAFKLFKEMTNDTIRLQNEKIEKLQKENDDLRQQIAHLQVQMAQWVNTVCYDASCKLRKTGFSINNNNNYNSKKAKSE